MQIKGVVGKIARVDLSSGEVAIERLDPNLTVRFLGGYGLGACLLFTRQPAGVDPLGPDATLGFMTGPLTGTQAITGNRFAVVGKSPKTGGWGDANCGGRFGPALKQAGLDAILVTGTAPKPVYLLVADGQVSIQDAASMWGRTCSETEQELQARHGQKAHAAVIGPAGERVSALAAIINDGGRAAGRSGLGMVMGAKRLKAVVALAGAPVAVADEAGLKAYRQELLEQYFREENPVVTFFRHYGTPGALEPCVKAGDAPIRNWRGSARDFSEFEQIGANAVKALIDRPYGCWQCPLACGGRVRVTAGPYAGAGHKPEYETLGAFGTMCLNHNLESICRLNHLCNDYGMDTISTGATVAFAMECFENGLISSADLDGIRLHWGDHQAMVRFTEQLATGEGFAGRVFGSGVQAALPHLGAAAAAFAMTCGGEELPMHDPRCYPGIAASFVLDATPGRHTQSGSWTAESHGTSPGSGYPKIADKYRYDGKGESHKYLSCFGHAYNAAGLCMFGTMISPEAAVPRTLTLAMGHEFSMEEVLEIGERIANLRICFNLREGVRNLDDYRLPARVLGIPPLEHGRTRGVSVDNAVQIRDYCLAMGWDPVTGIPAVDVLKRLGLEFALSALDAVHASRPK